jgi:predicted transcriptional regulator
MATKEPIISDEYAENITRVEELAYELRINEVMTENVYWLDPDMQMEKCARHLPGTALFRCTGHPENGKLIGILSIEDLIHALRKKNLDAPVREYMTTSPTTFTCTGSRR